MGDMVIAMRFYRIFPVLVVALSCLGVTEAEILSVRRVGDKTVMCMHSGMISELSDCGNRSNWYTYVFVGHISAIKPAKDHEKQVQIVPEEVFSGKPDNPVIVLTSQGLCLPKLAVGDRWLFYLRKVNGQPIILDYYGNDSLPVSDARAKIETLRRLKKIGEFGILRGRVVRGVSYGEKPVPHANVIANRRSDNLHFDAVADTDGHYEFQPLPTGKYRISVRPIGIYQPDSREININPGTCWDLTLDRFPGAQIGGHLERFNGQPAPGLHLVLISADNLWSQTTQTDQNGHFHFDQHDPGDYVLGLISPDRPGWRDGSGGGPGVKIPTVALYYPGENDRSRARVIRVKDDEILDLDFKLPMK